MPPTWRDLLEELAPAFSRRSTHRLFVVLACGMILADCSTVVGMAAAAGIAVARLIVRHLLADGDPVVVAMDGTFFKRTLALPSAPVAATAAALAPWPSAGGEITLGVRMSRRQLTARYP